MIKDLNILCTVTRKLSLVGRAYVVADDPDPVDMFMCALELPLGNDKSDDGSPRGAPRYILRWRQGLLGSPDGDIQAGDRVALTRPLNGSRHFENRVYEVIDTPRLIRVGHDNQGFQTDILPVEALYPYETILKEQGGTTVFTMNVALWSGVETHQSTGTYEEFNGEAAVEYALEIRANRTLNIGPERYMITASTTDFHGPRVLFDARRSNA